MGPCSASLTTTSIVLRRDIVRWTSVIRTEAALPLGAPRLYHPPAIERQFLLRCSALRQASAWAVSVGLCAPLVPMTDAPPTPRLGTSGEKPKRLTTLVSRLSPMRVPP